MQRPTIFCKGKTAKGKPCDKPVRTSGFCRVHQSQFKKRGSSASDAELDFTSEELEWICDSASSESASQEGPNCAAMSGSLGKADMETIEEEPSTFELTEEEKDWITRPVPKPDIAIKCDPEGVPLQCPICLENDPDDMKILEPCGHAMHNFCAEGMRNELCPICRIKVTNWGKAYISIIKSVLQDAKDRETENMSYAVNMVLL